MLIPARRSSAAHSPKATRRTGDLREHLPRQGHERQGQSSRENREVRRRRSNPRRKQGPRQPDHGGGGHDRQHQDHSWAPGDGEPRQREYRQADAMHGLPRAADLNDMGSLIGCG